MKPLPGMFSDEALDLECYAERPDEDAPDTEDEARYQHLVGWCTAHQTTPDRLTSRQIEEVWVEWRAMAKKEEVSRAGSPVCLDRRPTATANEVKA